MLFTKQNIIYREKMLKIKGTTIMGENEAEGKYQSDSERVRKLTDEYVGTKLNAIGTYIYDIYHGYPYGDGGTIELRNMDATGSFGTIHFKDLDEAEQKLEDLASLYVRSGGGSGGSGDSNDDSGDSGMDKETLLRALDTYIRYMSDRVREVVEEGLEGEDQLVRLTAAYAKREAFREVRRLITGDKSE